MPTDFSDLPLDIILYLYSFLPPSSLTTLCLASKSFNELITPLLYRSINLETEEVAYRCCLTIIRSTKSHGSFVQKFHVQHTTPTLLHLHYVIPLAIQRMDNLISFQCHLNRYIPRSAFWTALGRSRSTLQRLDIAIHPVDSFLPHGFYNDLSDDDRGSSDEYEDNSDSGDAEEETDDSGDIVEAYSKLEGSKTEFNPDSIPTLPQLTDLGIVISDSIDSCVQEVDKLIRNHASRIRRLSIYTAAWNHIDEYNICFKSCVFPVLEELSIDSSIQLPDPSSLPNLRTLRIPLDRETVPWDESAKIPVFPNISSISCGSSRLSRILPCAPSASSIIVDPPSPLEERNKALSMGQAISRLSVLSARSRPLPQLDISIQWLDLLALNILTSTFTNVQDLTIRFNTISGYAPESMKGLGNKIFARLKGLQSLSFAHTSSWGTSYEEVYMQNASLDEWSAQGSTLSKVSFAPGMVWSRTNGKWSLHYL